MLRNQFVTVGSTCATILRTSNKMGESVKTGELAVKLCRENMGEAITANQELIKGLQREIQLHDEDMLARFTKTREQEQDENAKLETGSLLI